MKRNHLRRRFSFALPALVFLSFSVLERVEVATVTETLVSLGTADTQTEPLAPIGRIEKAIHCPSTVCDSPQGCRRFTDA
jgi:hypothetical protein